MLEQEKDFEGQNNPDHENANQSINQPPTMPEQDPLKPSDQADDQNPQGDTSIGEHEINQRNDEDDQEDEGDEGNVENRIENQDDKEEPTGEELEDVFGNKDETTSPERPDDDTEYPTNFNTKNDA